MTHTPGPRIIAGGEFLDLQVVAPSGEPLAETNSRDVAAELVAAPETAAERDRLRGELAQAHQTTFHLEGAIERLREINAELLAALEAIVEVDDEWEPDDDPTQVLEVFGNIAIEARAAIARAKGETDG